MLTTRAKESRQATAPTFRHWAGGPRVIVALVFTDIVESTRIGNELGDEGMELVRRAHFRQARKFIRRYRGYEIKTIGDSFMVAFRSAVEALDFAVELHANTGHQRVAIRAGLHIGTIRVEKEDAYGAMVNFASRVAGCAKGSEIWVSEHAMEELNAVGMPRHRDFLWVRRPARVLKGFPGRHQLWSI